jgi:perosamine synthetase
VVVLAIDGGEKVRHEPFPRRGLFTEEERHAVAALFDGAIESGTAFGYGGPAEQAYEREFANYLGGGYADLVNSGTAAIYVALGALELEPAGEVIVPAISDYGGVMPAAMLNQVPVVSDTWPGSYNVGPDQIEAVLSPHTRAIVVAHISGEPADMDPILKIADARDIPVIEDCAQAHGATYKGRPVGTMGTAGAFSTMSGKHHATAAQGGVVFTHNEDLYWRVKRFADRGKPFNTDAGSNLRAGLNLNGSDLAAAVGRVQLGKLASITCRRQTSANAIREGIAHLTAVRPMRRAQGAESAYWFMPIHVAAERITVDKDRFASAVSAEGVPLSITYGRVISHAIWFRERKVFGTSDYPWGLPDYGGDRDAEFPCPNAVEAMASHFVIRLHEAWGLQEASDAVAALEKVEQAYLK